MFYIVYLFKGLHYWKLVDWNVGCCQQIVFKVQVADWMPEEIILKVNLVSQVALFFLDSVPRKTSTLRKNLNETTLGDR